VPHLPPVAPVTQAAEAHARGLAIALKNNFYMAPEMSKVHDMVLSEQCYQYSE
jgi:hypothetical protein